jgi:hypothetical protein
LIDRLNCLLANVGYLTEIAALEAIFKFCYFCQLNVDAFKWFKFTLKDDVNFNYKLLVDVMYLKGRLTLYVVDSATFF